MKINNKSKEKKSQLYSKKKKFINKKIYKYKTRKVKHNKIKIVKIKK